MGKDIFIFKKSKKKWPTQTYSLTSKSVENQLEKSLWNYLLMQSQEPLKISEHYAQEKKVWDKAESLFTSKDLNSTESLLDLWPKEVILQLEMEQVESQFMELNSKMKISQENIQEEDVYQWQMPDQTPMDLNFSYVLSKLHG